MGASFFAGVLVYHLKERRLSATGMNIAFWFSALTMALLFYYPKPVTFLTSMAWVALVSPTVVLSGAGVRLSGKGRALALSGGALSYPTYALHYPIFCWINGFYQVFAERHHGVLIEGPLLLAGIVLGSYFALKSFDEPLRHAPQ
ncbi:hypothetical protein [Bradyrhizobium sp.]|uniref:hypothetical protein n=1 Tax=Bradyrhizobium sp. TaxID=376 RepID=UPI003C3CAACE